MCSSSNDEVQRIAREAVVLAETIFDEGERVACETEQAIVPTDAIEGGKELKF